MIKKSIVHESSIFVRTPLQFSFDDRKIRSFIKKQSEKRFQFFMRQLSEETIVKYKTIFDQIVKHNGADLPNMSIALYFASLYHPEQVQSGQIANLFGGHPQFKEFSRLAKRFYM